MQQGPWASAGASVCHREETSLAATRLRSTLPPTTQPSVSFSGPLPPMFLPALNDYRVRIPIADFRRWPVMLALKMNGQYMSVRDKGPIWVVYPNHLDPELGQDAYQARWIWQLVEITFE